LPFKLNQDRRHHIPKQKRKVTNSAAYDAALRQRGSLTIWFTDGAIESWRAAPRTTPGGQLWYSPLAILTALSLRAVFRLALRQTEGLIGSIIGLLGLALAVPDHSTLSRRAKTLQVPRPGPRRDGEPLHLLVDSTGLRLCGAGEWLAEKHGTKIRRSWRKLHIGLDADTGQIAAATLTTKDVDDATTAPKSAPCSTRWQEQWPPSPATAPTIRTVFPPASSSVIPRRPSSCRRARPPCRARWPRPNPPRETSICGSSPSTGAGSGSGPPGYTKRARVEAAVARWKQVIGDGLRSRTDEGRATEVDVAVHVLNRMLQLGCPSSVRIA
jgi:hypothetical protein